MAKIESEQRKYARVMHHIGGHAGATAASDMILGGEDNFTLLSQEELQKMVDEGVDVERLVTLGSLREATPDEVMKWEVAEGIREAAPDSKFFANFTTGNETLHSEVGGAVGASLDDSKAPGSANAPVDEGDDDAVSSSGSASYKGMTKGDLSEYTVPELKEMAKEEGVDGYATMLKDDLLNALLTVGK
jgi:hypothetical protein